MTDAYTFSRSNQPQGVDFETNFQSKNWNYIGDINSSTYSNGAQTLVQFDCSSIYNSSQLINLNEAFFVIPITYTTVFVNTANVLVPPTAGMWASTGLKPGYFQLVNSIDVTIGGKVVSQTQNYTNLYTGLKLMSQMSQDDLRTYGSSLGLGDEIDGVESLYYGGATVSTSGTGAFPAAIVTGGFSNGMSNNTPFPLGAAVADGGDEGTLGTQFLGAYNKGLFSRLKKFPDLSAAGSRQNLFGVTGTGTNINGSSQLRNSFQPYYTVVGNVAVWYDLAVIKLADICDCVKQLPMTRKMDAVIRLYLNCGTVVSNVTATTNFMMTSASSNTFTNTCPLVQCNMNAFPTATYAVASGLFIGTPTTTSLTAGTLAGINLANGVGSHFLTSCRLYFPQITLKANIMQSYLSNNSAKTICYTEFLTNTISNVTAGSTYSALIQSGVVGIRGVWICPFLAQATNGTQTTNAGAITPFSDLLSPHSMAPWQNGPILLNNLHVSVGGCNVLQGTTLNYNFENFIEQVSLYEKLCGGQQLGLSCGLINEMQYAIGQHFYYIDCTRGTDLDQTTARNISISFTNQSLVSIDCITVVEYFVEAVIDVSTGVFNKK